MKIILLKKKREEIKDKFGENLKFIIEKSK